MLPCREPYNGARVRHLGIRFFLLGMALVCLQAGCAATSSGGGAQDGQDARAGTVSPGIGITCPEGTDILLPPGSVAARGDFVALPEDYRRRVRRVAAVVLSSCLGACQVYVDTAAPLPVLRGGEFAWHVACAVLVGWDRGVAGRRVPRWRVYGYHARGDEPMLVVPRERVALFAGRLERCGQSGDTRDGDIGAVAKQIYRRACEADNEPPDRDKLGETGPWFLVRFSSDGSPPGGASSW